MNPQQPSQQQPSIQVNNPLSAMAEGERIIFEVRRHPFGLIGMYISLGILLIIAVSVAMIAPSVLTDYDSSMVRMIGVAVVLIVALLALIVAFVAHIVYYGNRWILTSDSLTQISQRSLFDKQNSQLSLANLEDISAHQDGIMSHMFGFGLLKVETAGEHSKFSFPFCPNPNKYAQQILMAREAFEQGEHYKQAGQTPAQPGGVNTNTQ